MIEKTIKCLLVAKQEGIYKTYIFKNLENNEYIWCTKLPNWDVPDLKVNDNGFITVEIVEAGEKYYNRKIDEQSTYQYTGVYITRFIAYDEEKKDIIRL